MSSPHEARQASTTLRLIPHRLPLTVDARRRRPAPSSQRDARQEQREQRRYDERAGREQDGRVVGATKALDGAGEEDGPDAGREGGEGALQAEDAAEGGSTE